MIEVEKVFKVVPSKEEYKQLSNVSMWGGSTEEGKIHEYRTHFYIEGDNPKEIETAYYLFRELLDRIQDGN